MLESDAEYWEGMEFVPEKLKPLELCLNMDKREKVVLIMDPGKRQAGQNKSSEIIESLLKIKSEEKQKEVLLQWLEKRHGTEDLCNLASEIHDQMKNDEFIKMILINAEKALGEEDSIGHNIYPIIQLAESVTAFLGDTQWGRSVYIEAEKEALNNFESESYQARDLAKSIISTLNDKEWVIKLFKKIELTLTESFWIRKKLTPYVEEVLGDLHWVAELNEIAKKFKRTEIGRALIKEDPEINLQLKHYLQVNGIFSHMPLTLRYSREGHIAHTLIPRGTELPASYSFNVSSGSGNNKVVFCLGETPILQTNLEAGILKLTNILETGQSSTELSIRIDVNNSLQISSLVRVHKTADQVDSEFVHSVVDLTKESIKSLFVKALKQYKEDEETAQLFLLTQEANMLIEEAEYQGGDYKNSIEALQAAIAANDYTIIEKSKKDLHQKMHPLHAIFGELFEVDDDVI